MYIQLDLLVPTDALDIDISTLFRASTKQITNKIENKFKKYFENMQIPMFLLYEFSNQFPKALQNRPTYEVKKGITFHD